MAIILFGRALAHAFWAAVAEDARGQDGLVAAVDGVAHGLADEVIGNGKQRQIVFFEQFALGLAIAICGLVNLKVVSQQASSKPS